MKRSRRQEAGGPEGFTEEVTFKQRPEEGGRKGACRSLELSSRLREHFRQRP